MDWGNVSVEEVRDALQEVEWSTPPRPLPEFFGKFAAPRSLSKWTSRLKCNLYYYRTNYFILMAVILVFAFLRNPLALFAVALAAFSVACLNDSFALSLSQKLTRIVRRISPHMAAKMRPPITPVIKGRPHPRRGIYICGQNRKAIVLCLFIASLLLWYLTSAFVTVFGALALSLGGVIIHASFRTPNLKARLNTFREEFREVWRSYSEL